MLQKLWQVLVITDYLLFRFHTSNKTIDNIVRHVITLCVTGSASFSGRVEYQKIYFFKEGR